ncbi:TPA: thiazole biosynthesis adenylyltransferase ThiF [Vibrio cholerae]|nr:thiazole biosynthesis adenylyltransferase ThiF [Vibrio cholerae]HDZ9125634.1 thiazole biosynthesis adenylyltransferase ThiF [Vibrio cholerae]HDZ9290340.1 thiazole biosynthesis adenylyltransferase ThiF [Vibrio cholerae]
MLTDKQFLRYQRQISLAELGEEGQQKLLNSRVLIVGCGGLGNVVAPYLVGAGVGQVIIADSDRLELHNLHRQICYHEAQIGHNKAELLARHLRELNSEVRVRVIAREVDELILNLEINQVDLVLDCSDNLPTRHAINRACYAAQRPLISGAVIGWEGHLMAFDYRQSTPCYQCVVPDMAERQRCSDRGVIGPVVGMIGNGQALIALHALMGSAHFPANQLLRFDGKSMNWQSLQLHPDKVCPVCSVSSPAQPKEQQPCS